MTTYKSHYACFECRKTFKRKLLKDVDRDAAYSKERENISSKCPECAGLMANMGLDFESPPKKNIKAWTHMKNLYESGVTFHSCGCSGPGYIPKDKEELTNFLNKKKDQFIEQRKYWLTRIAPETRKDRHEEWNAKSQHLYRIPHNLITGTKKNRAIDTETAINYWNGRIEQVELRINKLNLVSK